MGASQENPLRGGCLCGSVRYEVMTEPEDAYHCHCSICRKCQGAAYLAYASIPRAGFRLLSGEEYLKTFDSSPSLHRRFCGTCGAHIYGDMDAYPDTVSLSVGTLDDGADPGGREGKERHIFWGSRIGWYEPGDDLPRLEEY